MRFSKDSCSHPLFQWAARGKWSGAPEGLVNPTVFCFQRKAWLVPTPEQIAVYNLSKRIVEQLGGSMNQQEYEIAGKAELLSAKDVKDILEAVRRDNPTAKVIDRWNGEGCYAMSVGVEFSGIR